MAPPEGGSELGAKLGGPRVPERRGSGGALRPGEDRGARLAPGSGPAVPCPRCWKPAEAAADRSPAPQTHHQPAERGPATEHAQ